MAQHDSLAVAAVIDPAVIATRLLPVDVENTGRLTSGMTVVDFRGGDGAGDTRRQSNCDVALEVDVARFRELLDTRLSAMDALLSAEDAR